MPGQVQGLQGLAAAFGAGQGAGADVDRRRAGWRAARLYELKEAWKTYKEAHPGTGQRGQRVGQHRHATMKRPGLLRKDQETSDRMTCLCCSARVLPVYSFVFLLPPFACDCNLLCRFLGWAASAHRLVIKRGGGCYRVQVAYHSRNP